MPAAPDATTLADLVLADSGGRGTFARMPRLTLRVVGTPADRLMGFLAMPDGTAAVLRLDEIDGRAELSMAIPEVGARVMLLEFPTAADADDFARRFDGSGVPGPGLGAGPGRGGPLPGEIPVELPQEFPEELPQMGPPPTAEAPAPAPTPAPAPAPGAPAAPGAPLPRLVAAQLHAEMKPVAVVGTPTVVRVRLSREPITASDGVVADHAEIRIDPERDVEVTLVPRGFRFAAGTRHTRRLRLPAAGGEAEVRFRIVGVEPGPGEVSVVVRQSTELPLATLRLTARIVHADGNGQVGIARQTAAVAPPDPHVASLPTIRVDEELVGGRSTLRIAVAVGGTTHRFSTKLRDKPAFVANVYAGVAGLRDELGRTPTAERAAVARGRMQQLGAALFESLFDRRARELLWQHRDELDGLVVQTTGEVDIPWEIVHITEPGTTAAGEPRFLAGYGLTRWVYDTAHPTEIPIRHGRARYLCPVYAAPGLVLRHTGAEGDGIRSRFTALAIEPDDAGAFGGLLSHGFDLLHFAGHGHWSAATARRQELLLGGFDADAPAAGSSYTDGDARRDLPDHPIPDAAGGPLVFLNACDVGRLPAGDVGLGGFPEAFLRGGAGAFIGCAWSVGDEPAGRFVDAFYDALLAGGTIASATREARAAARAEGDLSDLAYTVYAHPDARIRVD
jgi:hypothetical protein